MTIAPPAAQRPALRSLPGEFALLRWPADAALPQEAMSAPMCFVSRTDEELSLLCPAALAQSLAATAQQHHPGWRGIGVVGPLDFSIIGLLAELARILAQAQVSLFAVSTFDTDYLFVRSDDLATAESALIASGYHFPGSPQSTR
ncbi:MAG: ACT domain-containing protein [Pseudomonadota bacterium]